VGKSDSSGKGPGYEFGGKKLKQFNRLTRRVGKKVIKKEIGQD
jgi:hypothetical protein